MTMVANRAVKVSTWHGHLGWRLFRLAVTRGLVAANLDSSWGRTGPSQGSWLAHAPRGLQKSHWHTDDFYFTGDNVVTFDDHPRVCPCGWLTA